MGLGWCSQGMPPGPATVPAASSLASASSSGLLNGTYSSATPINLLTWSRTSARPILQRAASWGREKEEIRWEVVWELSRASRSCVAGFHECRSAFPGTGARMSSRPKEWHSRPLEGRPCGWKTRQPDFRPKTLERREISSKSETSSFPLLEPRLRGHGRKGGERLTSGAEPYSWGRGPS